MAMTVKQPVRWQSDHLFFTGMASVSLLTVLVGFAPTYFPSQHRSAAADVLFITCTGSYSRHPILLFLAQTALVAAHRTDIHRRLGVAGVVIASAVVVSAFSCRSKRSGAAAVHKSPNRALFFSIPLGDMITFAILVAAAVTLRRRADAHKRLMLLATNLNTLTAAVAAAFWPRSTSAERSAFFSAPISSYWPSCSTMSRRAATSTPPRSGAAPWLSSSSRCCSWPQAPRPGNRLRTHCADSHCTNHLTIVLLRTLTLGRPSVCLCAAWRSRPRCQSGASNPEVISGFFECRLSGCFLGKTRVPPFGLA